MAETLGTSTLELDGDLSKLEKKLAQAETKADKSGKKAGSSFGTTLQKGVLPAVAALGLVAAGGKKTIDSASALQEAVSAATVTFGKSADQILRWSKNQSDAFSQVEFLSAAKGFAVFGQTAGLNAEQNAKFSKSLIDAAGDMASFHDANPADVLADLKSGLAGETEPLRKYGILMNDAALKEEAMRQGLIKNTKEALSPQNKVLAAQALILKGLGPAKDDYARTSDSAANADRRQAANAEDLSAKMGKGLLPVYQTFQRILATVTTFMGNHTRTTQIGAAVVTALAGALLLTVGAMKAYKIGVEAARLATLLFNSSLFANPIGLVVLALVALGVALVVAYKKSERFRKIVDAAFGAVLGAAKAAWEWIKRHWPLLLTIIAGPIGFAVAKIVQHWATIREKTTAVWNFIRDKVVAVINRVRDAFALVRTTAMFSWNFVRDKAQVVIDKVKALIDKFRDLVSFIKSIPSKIKSSIDKLGDFFGGLIPRVPNRNDFRGIGEGLVGVAGRGPASVSRSLWDELSGANSMGLALSSGYRPGAITSSGNPSLHGVYPSKAIDVSGPMASMRLFQRVAAGRAGIRELLGPLGGWYPGVGWTGISRELQDDHMDHVHVGVYDSGGFLPPGVSLAVNNTGQPERVIGPGGAAPTFNFPHYVGDKSELMSAMREAVSDYSIRNGESPF